MAYRNEYKTQSEFNVILERGDDYEGCLLYTSDAADEL